MTLRIRLIGPMRVERDGVPLDLPHSRRTRALLGYLVATGREHRREQLCAMLWDVPDDPKGALRWSLSKIRGLLDTDGRKRVIADREAVRLDLDGVSVDLLALRALAPPGAPPMPAGALASAADLAEGTFLDGLDLPELESYRAWCVAERETVRGQQMRLLESLMEQLDDEPERALPHARRLVALDPYRIDGHLRLIGLLAAAGRREEAEAQRAAARRVAAELGPAAVHRLATPAGPAPQATVSLSAPLHATPEGPPLPDRPSIAVLPFANLSGDAEQEYFADGVSEDIATALSNVRSFFVIARDSAFAYKGRAVDARTVGRALGVHYLLQGSVRRSGERVRVTAQLIEAATGGQIWADRIEGTLGDIFDLQDQVAGSVVGAIEPELLRVEAARARQKRPDSLHAYDHLLRGLSLMNRLTPEDSRRAREHFLDAARLDPGFGRALVCASWCWRRAVQLNGLVLDAHDRSECLGLAERALAADPTDPYVLWQAGVSFALVGGDFDRGARMIAQSLSINANSARAWLADGIVRNFLGEPDAAIAAAQRAIRLSPLETATWVAHGVLAIAHVQRAEYEDAARWARMSIERHPFNLPAHHALVASLAQLGQAAAAEAARAELLRYDPQASVSRIRARFPIDRYRNLGGFLDGLAAAGVPA